MKVKVFRIIELVCFTLQLGAIDEWVKREQQSLTEKPSNFIDTLNS